MNDTELSYGTFVLKKAKKPVVVINREEFRPVAVSDAESNKNNSSQPADKKNQKIEDKQQKLRDKENQKMIKIALQSQKAVLKKAQKKKKKAEKTLRKSKALAASRNSHVKFSISAKLVGIITSLLVLSCMLIVFLATYFIREDKLTDAKENTLVMATRSAADVENRFESISSTVSMFYDLLAATKDADERRVASRSFFQRNKEIGGVAFVNSGKNYTNRQFFQSRELDFSLFDQYVLQETDLEDIALNGSSHVENASPFFGTPSLAVFYPFFAGNHSDVVVVLFSSEEISESFAAGSINESFLVNDEGQILVHPDISILMAAADYSEEYTVNQMLTSQKTGNIEASKQLEYEEEGSGYVSAYKRIKTGNCGVITKVQNDIILEGVNRTAKRNIYITIAIVALAVIIVWFFSKSISNPIKTLTAVTDEINKGNFNTELFEELSEKRADEIGVLINSTKNEREILNTVTSLTNKGVTKAIIKKEIDFQPHLKDITIFFSDIRGFTAISDGFNNRFGEKSAGEIIGFLNDYMSRMVNCITLTGGNVDKFEGDAIMACWGVLRDDNLDYEKWPDSNPEKKKMAKLHSDHIKKDAVSAVMASIAMRYSLMQYNKDAEAFTKAHEGEAMAKYKPHIRIGSGLNSGRATVGFMGSNDKMEFTSIGDAVNLASRTESSNKPCGTDLLITEDTYNILKKDFIRCEENNFTLKAPLLPYEIIVEMIPVTFEVKGKGKQHFYGVVNMPNFNIEEFFKKGDPNFKLDPDCAKACGPEGPKTLAEVRTLLGIPTPDFSGVNLDEEENKVKVN